MKSVLLPEGKGNTCGLYNGIEIPAGWPPASLRVSDEIPFPDLGTAYAVDDPRELTARRLPPAVPYLDHPPEVILIDVGRQLFIDDFLIEETDLVREYHLARKYEGNPVLQSETALEKPEGRMAGAAPKSGGLWWSPEEGVFKLWYEAGWCESTAYATSADGLHWTRPDLGGSNRIVPEYPPDSVTVFYDPWARSSGERFKMLLRRPGSWESGFAMVSGDGLNWSEPVKTGLMNDRSTMFYNPFRRKWIFSIRSLAYGRTRHYYEHDDFLQGTQWRDDEPVFWASADDLDLPDPQVGVPTQLYNLDAVAYESVMLGLFEILRGPNNSDCAATGRPKITDLTLAYSRDGFHWHRPDRRSFIASTNREGDWDRGYIQSVGGVCAVVGDELWFFYSGAKGGDKDRDPEGGMYANRSMGIAKLRRDGFASMRAGACVGMLLTRPLRFSGAYLFANVECPAGELRAEVLDESGRVFPGFGVEDSIPVQGDHAKVLLAWRSGRSLSDLAGQNVRFRFHLRNGDLFSFWVSRSERGESGGYLAAGGPGFAGLVDE